MAANSRNSGYSPSELSSMQQEAIERVREMQRRARQRVEQSNRMVGEPPPASPKPASARAPAGNTAPRAVPVPVSRQAAAPFQGILDRLNLDGDTALILILLLLLLNDGGDQGLILALVWLLL